MKKKQTIHRLHQIPEKEEGEASNVGGKYPISSSLNGRSEYLYDLYAVVHHQGALSTGHYVASLRSEIDGKWRLFNDAQVYYLDSKEVVNSSAYILFYVRRDVNSVTLNDFWDTKLRDGEGLMEEQIDKLTKQRNRVS